MLHQSVEELWKGDGDGDQRHYKDRDKEDNRDGAGGIDGMPIIYEEREQGMDYEVHRFLLHDIKEGHDDNSEKG